MKNEQTAVRAEAGGTNGQASAAAAGCAADGGITIVAAHRAGSAKETVWKTVFTACAAAAILAVLCITN